MFGNWDAKNTLAITGLHETLGRNHGIEEPQWRPSRMLPWSLNRPFLSRLFLLSSPAHVTITSPLPLTFFLQDCYSCSKNLIAVIHNKLQNLKCAYEGFLIFT